MKKRKRSEILNMLADCILELDEVREQLRAANETAAYWYKQYSGLEGRARVQGMPGDSTPARVPGSTSGQAGDLSELR